MLTGDNGILSKATGAKEKTIKAQYEEELNLVITTIRTDAIYKNEQFNMPYLIEKLPEYLEAEGKLDYVWDIIDKTVEEPEGEYKDYIFYIDVNYVAHIEAEATGVKPEIYAEILTKGNVLEGNPIEVKITATISEGTVEIIEQQGLTSRKITDTDSEKVYVYTIEKNGVYVFTAKGDSGRKNSDKVKINSIIDKPRITLSDNKGTSITINVENDYPEDVSITYKYYIGTIQKESKDKNCIIEGLLEETEYIAKVIIVYDNKELESDEVTFITEKRPNKPIIQVEGENEKQALDYPILTPKGMMTCYSSIKEGDKSVLKITNEDSNVVNYYSIDGGDNWIKYNNQVNIIYPGEGKLLAKSVKNNIIESEISVAIVEEIQYFYDKNILPTAEDALDIKAYDMDNNTCWDPNSPDSSKKVLKLAKDIDIYNVCFDMGNEHPTSGGLYAAVNGAWINIGTDSWGKNTEYIRDNILHTTLYGKGNDNYWKDRLINLMSKVYEIFYDETL